MRSCPSSARSPCRTSPISTRRAGSRVFCPRTPQPHNASVRPSATPNTAGRMARLYKTSPEALLRCFFASAELGEVLDPLARLPLGVVVLHRVDQLAHELGRQVDPGDDHPGDLLIIDLVVDAGEGDRELIVGVADVREVRIRASHDLRREVDV